MHKSLPLYNFDYFLDFLKNSLKNLEIYASSNPETNPNPVSKQAGGEHIKICFFTRGFVYYFGTSTVAVKLLL